MLKNEAQKYFTFKRNLILQRTAQQPLYFKRCRFYFDQLKNTIDFSTTLSKLVQRHPSLCQTLKETQLFYLDQVQQKNCFIGNYPLEQQVQIPFDNWQSTSITISCRHLIQKVKSNNLKQMHSIKKSKEKSISQAIACIQEWERQFKKTQERQKPLSKINAAKKIGINKKTLEDYIKCLKQGQKLGFDFQQRSNDKISSLRKFVKEKRIKSNIIGVITEDPDIYWQKDDIIKEKKHFQDCD